jgi:hypothetical protein
MTAEAATPVMPKHIEVNGHPIRLRKPQMILWSVIVGACGAALVAGAYYLGLQAPWHLDIGSLHLHDLKSWWDSGMGLFHSASWVLYRHGERDLGEPAVATMAVMTLLAGPKYWGTRVPAWRLLLTPVLIIVLAAALIAGGIWLINFGLPALARHNTYSWENLVLGFGIGRVLHRLWAPVGATIQGFQLDKAVARAHASGKTPLWVREPLMPPVIRERFTWMRQFSAAVIRLAETSRWFRVVMAVLMVVAFVLIVTGFIAHYWIGTGHTFWFLTRGAHS